MPEYNSESEEHDEILERFTKERIREAEGQQTFSTPDHEVVKPALEVIRKGEARCFIVALETKQGIKFVHRTNGDDHLMEMLNGMDEDG